MKLHFASWGHWKFLCRPYLWMKVSSISQRGLFIYVMTRATQYGIVIPSWTWTRQALSALHRRISDPYHNQPLLSRRWSPLLFLPLPMLLRTRSFDDAYYNFIKSHFHPILQIYSLLGLIFTRAYCFELELPVLLSEEVLAYHISIISNNPQFRKP